jgi:large subunit ribosomal protein L29
MTKAAELREHDNQELNTRLGESRRELFNLRFQLATGRLDNISRITAVRREIARLLTLLRQTELNIGPVKVAKRTGRSSVKTTEEK